MDTTKSPVSPRVSIGLPVYNGADYLEEAIESLVGQTFEDFELLLQDNASTDETEAICRAFAEKDPRISYARNATNLGAIANYNLVFQRARAPYFKWAAHDDVCDARFLEKCVEVLDAEPSIVLSSGQTRLINTDGSPLTFDSRIGCYVTADGAPAGFIDPPQRAEGPVPMVRFWDVLVRTWRSFEIFGLIRSDVLRQTRLMGTYFGSDKVLLAELALRGPFQLLPEVLLYRRCHSRQSSSLSIQEKAAWVGSPSREGMLSLRFKKLLPGYVHAVSQSPVATAQKLGCYGAIAYRFVAPQTWKKQFGRDDLKAAKAAANA